MPEHTSLLHYLLYRITPFREHAEDFPHSLTGKHLGYKDFEPVMMAAVLMIIIIYLTTEVRSLYKRLDESTVPEEKLSLRTFFEVFFEYFYNMARDIMGPKSAKRYFPLIGASAIFIFVSNAVSFIPGMLPPTASLNVTAGCAIFVFIAFNFYGLRDNGKNYLKHMAGWGVFHHWLPSILLALLMLPIELISICVRPVTLAIRLMVNMAVDHLLLSIFLGLFALLLPLPIMLLGIIVVCVQTLVFCMLTSIYIALATEHADEHH
jgi:F-type H+-transporting ATPase subunit a